jgi:uncharacterized protein YndB with AHSA1/START domain
VADPAAKSALRVAHVPSSVYLMEYEGTFTFPVPVARLWETLLQVDQFTSWWSWLQDFRVEGTELGCGSVLHGVVAPPVPYRMRIDVVLDDWVVEQRIAALVHGDLEGPATLTFEGDGTESRAHAVWALEMMQRPMRIAARVAYPLLRWGHDRVVDATVDGLRRQLVAERGG